MIEKSSRLYIHPIWFAIAMPFSNGSSSDLSGILGTHESRSGNQHPMRRLLKMPWWQCWWCCRFSVLYYDVWLVPLVCLLSGVAVGRPCIRRRLFMAIACPVSVCEPSTEEEWKQAITSNLDERLTTMTVMRGGKAMSLLSIIAPHSDTLCPSLTISLHSIHEWPPRDIIHAMLTAAAVYMHSESNSHTQTYGTR